MLDKALLNLLVGSLRIAVVGVLGLFLTKILIESMGVETYGIIALFTSLNSYLGLFLIAISGTVFKFASIEYFKEKTPYESIKYLVTAFYSILLMSILLLVALYLLLPWLNTYVDFSDNDEDNVKSFFIMSVASFLIANICAVFFVPTMIKNKLYFNDIANMLAVILRFLLVILLFYIFDNLNLNTYGVSLLVFGVIYLSFSALFAKKIMPELSFNYKYFSLKHTKDMIGMGWKVLLNNIGIILYTNTDLIIINSVLGTLLVADYAIPMQLGMLVALFGGMMSRLYNPLISRLISNDKNKVLGGRLICHTKVFTLFIGVIFVFLTVFSLKLLNFWLGVEYIRLYFILILLALYHFLHQSTVLFSSFFNLTNNLTIPLLVTLFAGVTNIFISLALLEYTDLGVVGVIIATLITVFCKTNLFNTIYTSFLLKISLIRLMKSFLPLYSYVLIFSYFSFEVFHGETISFRYFDIISLFIILFFYFFIAYFGVLNKKEKIVFLRITKIYNLIKR